MSDQFDLMKNFTIEFMDHYEVGPDPLIHSRFAILQFSNNAKEEFTFDTYSNRSGYYSGVKKIVQLGRGEIICSNLEIHLNCLNLSGTSTHNALNHLATEAFKENKGARQGGK